MSLFSKLKSLVLRLWSPAIFAYGISGAVAISSFLSTLVIARMGGPVVIGHYALAVATANMLVVLAIQGLDRILIRQVAGDLREKRTGRARQALALIARRVGISALVVSAGWLAVILLTSINEQIDGDWPSMMMVTVLIVFVAGYRISVSMVRATDSPIIGQLIEATPTVLLPLLLGILWVTRVVPTAALMVCFIIGLNIVALMAAVIFLRPRVRQWGSPENVEGKLLTSGWPMMANLMMQLFVDWLILAKLSGVASPADAGAFRVTMQIITIFLTILATTETYIAARFAGDFRVGRYDLAWSRYRKGRILMAVLAGPPLLVCLLASEWLLGGIFGPSFAIAANALLIMTVGQIINIGKGPLGSMLTMAGYDGLQLKLTIASTIVGVLACMILIPRLGLVGGAIAQVLPLLIRGICGYIAIHTLIPRQAIRRD